MRRCETFFLVNICLIAVLCLEGCQTYGSDVAYGFAGQPTVLTVPQSIRIDQTSDDLSGLPEFATDATLAIRVGSGPSFILGNLSHDTLRIEWLTARLAERLRSNLASTDTFRDVSMVTTQSELTGRVYSLEVKLEPGVAVFDPLVKPGALALDLDPGEAETNRLFGISISTEANLFLFGGSHGARLIMVDTNRVTGETAARPDQETESIRSGWEKAVDVAAPHLVRAVLEKVHAAEMAPYPLPAGSVARLPL